MAYRAYSPLLTDTLDEDDGDVQCEDEGRANRRHGDDGDSVMMWPRLASGDERLRVHGVAVVITLSMDSAQSCSAAGRVDHVRSGCNSSLAMVIAMASGGPSGPTRRRTAAAATPIASSASDWVGTLALIVEATLITISVARIVGLSSARRAQAVSAANSRPDTVELMRAGSARTGDTQPQANWN
jgi:hypothetical protein